MLYEVITEKANLTGTSLFDADMSGANLEKADLHDSDMTGLQLEDAQLGNAIWQDRKRCRPGSVGECR